MARAFCALDVTRHIVDVNLRLTSRERQPRVDPWMNFLSR
jgi:hypothetical protein